MIEKTNRYLAVILVVMILLGSIGIYLNLAKIEIPSGALGGPSYYKENLIGTHDSPHSFTAAAATTTSPVFQITPAANVVDINLITLTASSSTYVTFIMYKSNDSDCASSTATDIYWQDMEPQISASGKTVTVNTATTTYNWTPGGNGDGTSIQFTNVNTRCVKADISSASTTIWAEMQYKIDAN